MISPAACHWRARPSPSARRGWRLAAVPWLRRRWRVVVVEVDARSAFNVCDNFAQRYVALAVASTQTHDVIVVFHILLFMYDVVL